MRTKNPRVQESSSQRRRRHRDSSPRLVFPAELNFDSPIKEGDGGGALVPSHDDGEDGALKSPALPSGHVNNPRITEDADMTEEQKQKFLEERMERKRKHSREWHSKYASKGVP